MKYAFLSGFLWGIDTALLAVLTTFLSYNSSTNSVIFVGILGALLHDAVCAIFMWIYISTRKKWHKTLEILNKPRILALIIVGSLLGGPLGMSGYVLAASNIGAGYAAAISAFYPAVGTVLSALILRERLSAAKYAAFALALIAVSALGYFSCAQDAQSYVNSNTILGLAGAILSVVGWGSEAVVCAWATRQKSIDDEIILHIRQTTSAFAYVIIAIIAIVSSIFVSSTGTSTGTSAVTSTGLESYISLNTSSLQSFKIAGMAIIVGLLGVSSYLCYYRGIAKVGASRAMAANVTYAAWSMIVTAIISFTMPSVLAWICCITIMCSTVFVARQ
ncbi:EamA family transporter [Gardnerella greenwoodii]|uniref:EamA family transporter n=1 Tax=Gardnerella greenwoodii TaxID=2914925 RepID=A0A2N6RWV4_9BIFI|nr:EamA family transporter [Gardnerella greenwoodii]MDF0753874.1 EamA family transporter [Gardnerella greenwoodii]PMC42591.1 EamA family transporter [Gardnerella greenwoodii]